MCGRLEEGGDDQARFRLQSAMATRRPRPPDEARSGSLPGRPAPRGESVRTCRTPVAAVWFYLLGGENARVDGEEARYGKGWGHRQCRDAGTQRPDDRAARGIFARLRLHLSRLP